MYLLDRFIPCIVSGQGHCAITWRHCVCHWSLLYLLCCSFPWYSSSSFSGVVSGTTVRALILGRFSQKILKIELKDNAKKWIRIFHIIRGVMLWQFRPPMSAPGLQDIIKTVAIIICIEPTGLRLRHIGKTDPQCGTVQFCFHSGRLTEP